jgi:hypothetical protein
LQEMPETDRRDDGIELVRLHAGNRRSRRR